MEFNIGIAMHSGKDEKRIYIIKQRKRIELPEGPFEYEELVGKCTSRDDAEKIIAANPGSYLSEEQSVYSEFDLFRFE